MAQVSPSDAQEGVERGGEGRGGEASRRKDRWQRRVEWTRASAEDLDCLEEGGGKARLNRGQSIGNVVEGSPWYLNKGVHLLTECWCRQDFTEATSIYCFPGGVECL